MNMETIISGIVITGMIVGGLVHLFPSWLEKATSNVLFRIARAPVSVQRIIGLILSIAGTILGYRLIT